MKQDCEKLGLDEAELACLSGFTYRAAEMLAHLREAWLAADLDNARAIECGLAAMFEGHSFQRNRELFERVLRHNHERGDQLIGAVNALQSLLAAVRPPEDV